MPTNYLALDIGRARIGVAIANDVARIAAPLPFLPNDETFGAALQALLTENNIGTLVVGLPRGLDGQETEQTSYVEDFVAALELPLPIVLQDEALTSVKAEAELQRRGKTYEKGDIDSLSAVYILEDFLQEGVH